MEAELFRARRIKLIEALESDKYKQGKRVLTNAKTGRYCCLGVACELAKEDGLEIEVTLSELDVWDKKFKVLKYDNDAALLPTSVQRYYGFYSGSGDSIDYTTSRGDVVTSVVEMNDRGISFKKIASIMRKQWVHGLPDDE